MILDDYLKMLATTHSLFLTYFLFVFFISNLRKYLVHSIVYFFFVRSFLLAIIDIKTKFRLLNFHLNKIVFMLQENSIQSPTVEQKPCHRHVDQTQRWQSVTSRRKKGKIRQRKKKKKRNQKKKRNKKRKRKNSTKKNKKKKKKGKREKKRKKRKTKEKRKKGERRRRS